VSWESWTEQLVRQGIERGELEVGEAWRGRPLPGKGTTDDELWWVRRKLRDEEVSFLPPQLAIRAEVEEARARIAAAAREDEVRRLVGDINDRIRQVNRTAVTGPPTTVGPLDVEQTVERWRADRD